MSVDERLDVRRDDVGAEKESKIVPVDDRLGAGPEVGFVREQAKQQEIVDAQHFAMARSEQRRSIAFTVPGVISISASAALLR